MADEAKAAGASLTLVRRIAAPIDQVWTAISDAAQLKRWLGPKAFEMTDVQADVRVGGRFSFRMRSADGSWFAARGTYVDVVPGERMSLTWRWTEGAEDQPPDTVESLVTIALQTDGDATALTLTHARLADAASADSHRGGWSEALDKLAARIARAADPAAIEALVDRYFAAWIARDRGAIEAMIAPDFHFTSPLDNRLDRAAFFTRCWPGGEDMERVDVRHVHPQGDRSFVAYQLRMKDGRRFVNAELWTVEQGRLVDAEVYFGWPVPHDAPPGGFKPVD